MPLSLQESPEKYTVFKQDTRTTSAVESYNRVLNSKIKPNGDFWSFVTAIQEEEQIKLASLKSVLSGNNAVYRNKPKQQTQKENQLKQFWDALENNKISPEIFLKFVIKSKKNSLLAITAGEGHGQGTKHSDHVPDENKASADGTNEDEASADGPDEDEASADEKNDDAEHDNERHQDVGSIVDDSLASSGDTLCRICHVQKASAFFLVCRHMYACDDCAKKQKKLKENAGIFTCSICRCPVQEIMILNS